MATAEGGFVFPVLIVSFLGVGSLSLSEETDSTEDWLDEQEEALLTSTTFLGGGPFSLLPLLLFALSLELESSFSVGVNVEGEVSLSSLDFLGVLLPPEALALALEDLLSDSDSELLSGENILFFFMSVLLAGFDADFDDGLGVLPPTGRGGGLPLASTDAAALGLVDPLLRGGKGLGLAGLTVSSSLDEDALAFVDDLLGLASSFFFSVSSVGFAGDFGAVSLAAAGVSEADDSESELLEPDPELVDELPLLLESEEEPELLSVLEFFFLT